jgi:hypothetical protein
MAMVLGCFLLAVACLVVGWVVIQQRLEGPPKPTEESLSFNLGVRLDRQISLGDKTSDEGKAALQKEDYITANARLSDAVKLWESAVNQISQLRSKPEYSGDEYLGYEVKAQQVNQKVHDARQMLTVIEFRAMRQRLEQDKQKAPPPPPVKATVIPDNYDPDYEEQVQRAKMKAELRKKEAEEKAAREKAAGKTEEPKTETPTVQEAPAPKAEEPKPEEKKEEPKAEEPKAEEPAPAPKPIVPKQKNADGELKVDDFQ